MHRAILYLIFAVVATAANLATQFLSFALLNASLVVGMAAGTATGLGVKYLLDKMFVFRVKWQSPTDEIGAMLCYSLTGVATTLLFWGTEYFFNAALDSQSGRYIGAIVGLSMGYYIKYRLDKNFVFRETAS